MRERDIFIEALQRGAAGDVDAYLDATCGGDDALRGRVNGLLAEHRRQGAFILDSPLGGLDSGPGLAVPPAQLVAERPGGRVGPYELVEQVGEGGMGVVFIAQQHEPVRRRVALKVIKAGMDTRQVIARFEAERQALAMMDHESIARVFDAGTTDTGRPYFVMELVDGVPITDYCERDRLPPRERLKLFVRVCRAVQHAHTKGLIHRDLKPTNVLVAVQDGRPVPKVIDFGVAKATGPHPVEHSLFTHVDQMVGTPLYMSPEQAQLGGVDVDTRSDVYSLGVLLYELLTGTTPFDRQRLGAAGLDEVRRIVREEEPPRPSARLSAAAAEPSVTPERGQALRRLTAVVRGELDWVVMKALEKDRSRRYETVTGLARDVESYLRDEPVSACPPSAWYRFRKFARRRKAALAVTSALAAGVLLAVIAVAASAILVRRTNDELKRALAREQGDSYFQRVTVAHRELYFSDNLGGALKILDECPPNLRGWEWDYLMRLCRVEPLVVRDACEVASVAFSPDGARIASAGADGFIKVWNSRTGKLLKKFPAHKGWAFSVAFHPGGKHVVSAGEDRRFRVWDLADDRRAVYEGPCDAGHMAGTAYAVAFSPEPDSARLAAGANGNVNVWDWRKGGDPVHTFPYDGDRAPTVAFSRDGRRLASGTWRGSIKIWDAERGGPAVMNFPAEDKNPVTALAFDRTGDRLAQAGYGRRVIVWSTKTGELVRTFPPHTGLVACMAYHPDGNRLASAGEDKTVRLWDAGGREVLGLRGHVDPCLCLTFSPDGLRLASAGRDRTIRVWDATPLTADERKEKWFARHDNEVWRVALSPDGERVAAGGFRTPVHLYDARSAAPGGPPFTGHPFVTFDLCWQPLPPGATAGTAVQRIASAGFDGVNFTVKVWDARTGREAYSIRAARELFAVAFSPDRRHIITGGMDRTLRVWDASTGREIATIGGHAQEIRAVTFSADGRHIASAGGGGEVKLWDATGLPGALRLRHSLPGRVPGQCLNIAFSPDGQTLAGGAEANTVKVWDAATGNLRFTLRGHTADVYAVAFSPGDGRWIATAGEDSTVKVWDGRTGELVRSFRGHAALVGSVAFSPDGRRLFSGSRDHTVKVWDLTQLGADPTTAPSAR